ncbi:hypothetical protein AOLI_G00151690 [Acnodon oligacanthus]
MQHHIPHHLTTNLAPKALSLVHQNSSDVGFISTPSCGSHFTPSNKRWLPSQACSSKNERVGKNSLSVSFSHHTICCRGRSLAHRGTDTASCHPLHVPTARSKHQNNRGVPYSALHPKKVAVYERRSEC